MRKFDVNRKSYWSEEQVMINMFHLQLHALPIFKALHLHWIYIYHGNDPFQGR